MVNILVIGGKVDDSFTPKSTSTPPGGIPTNSHEPVQQGAEHQKRDMEEGGEGLELRVRFPVRRFSGFSVLPPPVAQLECQGNRHQFCVGTDFNAMSDSLAVEIDQIVEFYERGRLSGINRPLINERAPRHSPPSSHTSLATAACTLDHHNIGFWRSGCLASERLPALHRYCTTSIHVYETRSRGGTLLCS